MPGLPRSVEGKNRGPSNESNKGSAVDTERFDRWTKSLAKPRSRRGVLGALAGGAVALVTRQAAPAQIAGPGIFCGGIAGLQCPAGFACVDAVDGCDPNAGGFDCSGICVPIDYNPCAAILCIEGTTCCPRCGGICIPSGVPCGPDLCASEPCNQAVCGPGEYCCNESCGICAPLGGGCIALFCEPPGQGVPCGPAVCPVGQVCCNESCGICTPPGGACIDLFCEPPGFGGVPCGPTICPIGQVCCNESCGICTPPGGACIMIACVD